MNFINKKQVCEELQISSDTFQAWVAKGLPEYRIGRIILVKRSELDEFIGAHGSAAVNEKILQMLEVMK